MFNNKSISIIDCPRDAIQSMSYQIPTAKKVAYLNQLIQSELFDCIDFGSFVSARAVPQMSDTEAVIEGLIKDKAVKLLAIIANLKGAQRAVEFEKVDYLGYPFSISETFQKNNTRQNINESFDTVRQVLDVIASKSRQNLMVYISMAFGNPYGDIWDMDLVSHWVEQLIAVGVSHFSLADTTSQASPNDVKDLFSKLRIDFPAIDFNVHLHSRSETAMLKVEAAYEGGCRAFEGAILGYGGCQFTQNELIGNVPTELLVNRFKKEKSEPIFHLMDEFQKMIRHDL